MKTKKMNSYKKMALTMLLAALGGGILGFTSFFILGRHSDHITDIAAAALTGFQKIMFPAMLLITVISVVYGQFSLRKQKMIAEKILETEDEECDRWEYEEELNSAWGMAVNILSQILCILVLSAGYSAKYIDAGHHKSFLIVCLVFLACFTYDGYWQIRFVKLTQKAHPEKIGDPTSTKFQKQWLASCDEAEKEVIYQSAYKSYCQVSKWIPALLVIVMLGHLFFNTGIMAIVVVALIWLISTLSYLRSCVSLKGAKIRE